MEVVEVHSLVVAVALTSWGALPFVAGVEVVVAARQVVGHPFPLVAEEALEELNQLVKAVVAYLAEVV